jgi:hypothetical protein
MKEELISFETAKLAKEKGFTVETIEDVNNRIYWEKHPKYANKEQYYKEYCDLDELLTYEEHEDNGKPYSAPTQSLLQRWLREEHKIEVSISWEQNMNWFYSIMWLWGTNAMITLELDDINNTKSGYKTYEEALEQGLIEALKLIEI